LYPVNAIQEEYDNNHVKNNEPETNNILLKTFNKKKSLFTQKLWSY